MSNSTSDMDLCVCSKVGVKTSGFILKKKRHRKLQAEFRCEAASLRVVSRQRGDSWTGGGGAASRSGASTTLATKVPVSKRRTDTFSPWDAFLQPPGAGCDSSSGRWRGYKRISAPCFSTDREQGPCPDVPAVSGVSHGAGTFFLKRGILRVHWGSERALGSAACPTIAPLIRPHLTDLWEEKRPDWAIRRGRGRGRRTSWLIQRETDRERERRRSLCVFVSFLSNQRRVVPEAVSREEEEDTGNNRVLVHECVREWVCVNPLRGPGQPSRWRAAPQRTWWDHLPSLFKHFNRWHPFVPTGVWVKTADELFLCDLSTGLLWKWIWTCISPKWSLWIQTLK